MFHDNPELAGLLLVVLLILATYQRSLGPRLRWPPALRRALLPAAEEALGDRVRALTRDKTHDGEYVCTVECSRTRLLAALFKHGGYRWNLFATLKYILVEGDRAYEVLSIAHRASLRAKFMHHVYGFKYAGEVYHLHAHREINYLHDPLGHTDGDQLEGDPDRTLRSALEAAGIEYTVLDRPLYGV